MQTMKKNSELITTKNELKLICGGLFVMVLIHFKLFWIFSKLSHEQKISINNSNAHHIILQRKRILELSELLHFKTLKSDRECGAKNAVHLLFQVC